MRHSDSSTVMDPDPFPEFSFDSRQKPFLRRDSNLSRSSSSRRTVHFESPLLPRCGSISKTTDYSYPSQASYPQMENMPKKASSMSSSSVVDDEGLDGPSLRSIGTLSERHPSHRHTPAPSAPAISSTRWRYRHTDDNDEEAMNPWKWPKLPPLNQSKDCTTTGSARQVTEVLTESQMTSLRSFLTAPKPVKLKSANQSTSRASSPPEDNGRKQDPNTSTKLSTVARGQAGKSWGKPKDPLSARREHSKNISAIQAIAKKPEQHVQEDDSDSDVLPMWDDLKAQKQPPTAHISMPEKKKSHQKQVGMRQKQIKRDQLPTAQKSHYGYVDSTSSKKLPSGLEKNSPTYKDKIHGWPMEPNSSPPLEPAKPPASHKASRSNSNSSSSSNNKEGNVGSGGSSSPNSRDEAWGLPYVDEQQEKESIRTRSNNSNINACWGASATEVIQKGGPTRSKSTCQKSLKSVHSFQIPEASQRKPSIAAGTIIWVDPVTSAGAGAEHWCNTTGLNIVSPAHGKTSHEGTSHRESSDATASQYTTSLRTASHSSLSQNAAGPDTKRNNSKQRVTSQGEDGWGLDPIPEDQPLKSHRSGSRKSHPGEASQWSATVTTRHHKRSGSQQPPSPTKSDPNKTSIGSSYRPPTVEDDTANWTGWEEPNWQQKSLHKGRIVSHSSGRDCSPKDLTPRKSGEREQVPKHGDPVDSWMAGRVPSERSYRSGYEPRNGSKKASQAGSQIEFQQWDVNNSSPTPKKTTSTRSKSDQEERHSIASSKRSLRKLDWDDVQPREGFF